MRNLLYDAGFTYNHTTKDFTKKLTESVTIRADIWRDRIKVFLQFDKVDGLDEYWDIVYMNTYKQVSFLKLINALKTLAALDPDEIKIEAK